MSSRPCEIGDEAIHRRRVEARVRNIADLPEITWARVLERRAEYEPWTDPRLVLDTSRASLEQLLDDALHYVRT